MESKKKMLLVAAAGLSLPLMSTQVALGQDDSGDIAAFVVDGVPSAADLESFEAYWSAGYDYDQLLALSAEWNIDEFEAKARAGALIQGGSTATLDELVAGVSARADVAVETAASTASFWDAGYSYDDAVELAEEWDLDDPYSAKIQAAEFIDAGRGDEVVAVLGTPG